MSDRSSPSPLSLCRGFSSACVLGGAVIALGAIASPAAGGDDALAELVESVRTVDAFARSGDNVDDPPVASRETQGPFNVTLIADSLFTGNIDGCIAVAIAFGEGAMNSSLDAGGLAVTGSTLAFRECSCGIVSEALGQSTFDVTWNVLRPARLWYRTEVLQRQGDPSHTIRLETADGVELIEDGSGPPITASRVFEPGSVRVTGGPRAASGEDCGPLSNEVDYDFDLRIVELADLDADGLVGTGDLLLVLEFWGPCPPPGSGSCLGDVDGDEVVNTLDLLSVLAAWRF